MYIIIAIECCKQPDFLPNMEITVYKSDIHIDSSYLLTQLRLVQAQTYTLYYY